MTTDRNAKSGPTGSAGQRKVSTPCAIRPDPHRSEASFEIGPNDMLALLARMRPTSDAEALRALRAAFPSTSLADRVAVLARRSH